MSHSSAFFAKRVCVEDKTPLGDEAVGGGSDGFDASSADLRPAQVIFREDVEISRSRRMDSVNLLADAVQLLIERLLLGASDVALVKLGIEPLLLADEPVV